MMTMVEMKGANAWDGWGSFRQEDSGGQQWEEFGGMVARAIRLLVCTAPVISNHNLYFN